MKLSALFMGFTFLVTLWMSFELGLLSFGKLEAAEETHKQAELKEAPVSTHKDENIPVIPNEKKTPAEVVVSAKETIDKKVIDSAIMNNPDKNSDQNSHEQMLSQREKQLSDKEEFLKKQSEYYEKVIMELKDKLTNQAKDNKVNLGKTESSFSQKCSQKEADWKEKLGKKEVDNIALQKELSTWKDARAELFRGLYEKMESKKGAKILETMDVDLSNKILAGMKQDKAAEIMSKMAPEKARLITERTFPVRGLSSLEKVNSSQATVTGK